MEPLEEYRQVVMDRFMSLSDEEKSVIGSLPGTPVGDALGKLFGPEMGDLTGMREVIGKDAEKSDMQGEPPLEATPRSSQMNRVGLGAR
jgi:hypothetical protein